MRRAIVLVFLDSNLFLIDRFFRRDVLYPPTRAFLSRLNEIPAVLSVLTLLELCGASSFRLGPLETGRWLHQFAAIYPVEILSPFGMGDERAVAWVGAWTDELGTYLARRMTLGDALLAREADRYAADAIVTWNLKDFERKTTSPVFTPRTYPGP